MSTEYLSAKDLEISRKEYRALTRVKEGLESGRYVHVGNHESNVPKGKRAFDLSIACERGSCGTVGCIGGWLAREMRYSIQDAEDYVTSTEVDSKIRHLFFPPRRIDYEGVTPIQAAQAIENFLRTGNPSWNEIVGG